MLQMQFISVAGKAKVIIYLKLSGFGSNLKFNLSEPPIALKLD